MVRVCDGAELPRADRSKVYLLRTYGNSAQELWDVSDPAKPSFVTTVASRLQGTHKNWWECDSGIAYLVSGVPGWRTSRMTQIYDLGNPARPVFVRNFGLPGQQPGASGPCHRIHGPIHRPQGPASISATAPASPQPADGPRQLLRGRKNQRRKTCSIRKLAAGLSLDAGAAFPLPSVGRKMWAGGAR
jgi:hypothetical protein